MQKRRAEGGKAEGIVVSCTKVIITASALLTSQAAFSMQRTVSVPRAQDTTRGLPLELCLLGAGTPRRAVQEKSTSALHEERSACRSPDPGVHSLYLQVSSSLGNKYQAK